MKFSSSGFFSLLMGSFLMALAYVLYGPTLHNPMLFDDSHFVVLNRSIRNLWNWNLLFHGGTQETRPLFNLSLALNYSLQGLDPVGYRIVNIGLHGICAILVFFLLSKVSNGQRPIAAFIAALIFLVHPLQTESINLVSARSGILASLLILLCLGLYHIFRSSPMKPKWALALSVFSGLLAQFAKEFAIILPVLIFLWEWILISRGKIDVLKKHLRPILLFYAPLLLVVPLLFYFFESPHSGVIGFDVMPVPEFMCAQAQVHLTYLKLLFWPEPLTLWYGPSTVNDCAANSVLFSVILISMLGAALFSMKRYPLLAFGVFLYFLNLAPTSSFIPRKDLYGERLLYLSIAGALFVGFDVWQWLQVRFKNKALSRIVLAMTALAVGWFSSLTWARNDLWQSELALWKNSAVVAPNHPLVQMNLGISFLNQNQVDKALEHFQKASELDPKSAAIHYKLGETLFLIGKKEEAHFAFDKALASGHQKTDILNNIGFLHFRGGDPQKAQTFYRAAIETDPDNGTAYSNLGLVFYNLKQFQEARGWFEKAISKDPLNPQAHLNLGTAYFMLNDFDAALIAFERSTELDPKSSQSWEYLGKAYLQTQRPDKALEAYQKAQDLNPQAERELILQKLKSFQKNP